LPVLRNIRLLAWFNFFTDFRPYHPIAILYFAQVSGSYALGMSVYSAIMLSQSLFEVPTGVFSDLIGRRRTVVCGAVAGVLSLTCYAVGGTYLALLAGGVFEGLARAFYSGNNSALLYDTLAEAGQVGAFQEYLGKTSSMAQWALAISALVGSLIAAISFQLVMWVSVIPMVLALLVSLGFVEPRAFTRTSANVYAHLGAAIRNFIHNPKLREISIAAILDYSIGESRWYFRSAFVATLWPVWALGIAQMLANATAAISFYFAGRIIRRFGELRLLISGIVFSESLFLFALLMQSVLSPVLIGMNSLLFGVTTVAMGGLLQREFSDEQRATMGSLTSLGGSIALAIFSLLLGALADRIGIIPALVAATTLVIIPMWLYWRALRGDTMASPDGAGQPIADAEVGSI
jgi:MFS family permease